MPAVSLAQLSGSNQPDAVVVGVVRTPSGPRLAPGAGPVDAAMGNRLRGALLAVGATGAPEEVSKIPTLGRADFPLVLATGVGDSLRPEALRRAAGAAARALPRVRHVHLAMPGPADALVEGMLLGGYSYTTYKSAPATAAPRRITVAAQPSRANRGALRHAREVAAAVTLARDLVNAPPNDLYPEQLAVRAGELGEAAGLAVEVLGRRALERGGYGGLLAVGAGSAREPRLIRLTHRPRTPVAKVALVGKGITFDSGGLNLKHANLVQMKSDMGGAAAVIAATLAVARLRVPVEVTATVPSAENMPSGSSYRPSDILRMRNGTTVEVADTDAEGRLVLVDAIDRAVQDAPDYLLEASTLTGAQLVALGDRVIAVMGEPGLRDRVVAAGDAAGESLWAMPLPEQLSDDLDSKVADLTNTPEHRWAGMLVGGAFLSRFVPDGLPWAHLDIAGPSWNAKAARDYTPVGATGAAVRTIIATVEALAHG